MQLTNPAVLVKTGWMCMLSVYHRGSVTCHLPASLDRIHHLLSIEISIENQSVTQEDTHTNTHSGSEKTERVRGREGRNR